MVIVKHMSDRVGLAVLSEPSPKHLHIQLPADLYDFSSLPSSFTSRRGEGLRMRGALLFRNRPRPSKVTKGGPMLPPPTE